MIYLQEFLLHSRPSISCSNYILFMMNFCFSFFKRMLAGWLVDWVQWIDCRRLVSLLFKEYQNREDILLSSSSISTWIQIAERMCTSNDEMPICCIVVVSVDAGDIFNGQYILLRIFYWIQCELKTAISTKHYNTDVLCYLFHHPSLGFFSWMFCTSLGSSTTTQKYYVKLRILFIYFA